MDVARGRSFGGVDVGVGVEPEEAYLLFPAAIEFGHAGDRAGGQGVVAAQQQRRHAIFQGLDHCLGGAPAGLGNLLEVARIFVAGELGFGDLDANVAAVDDLVAQGFQAGFQSSHAHRGGPHVYPARGWRPGRGERRGCECGGWAGLESRGAGTRRRGWRILRVSTSKVLLAVKPAGWSAAQRPKRGRETGRGPARVRRRSGVGRQEPQRPGYSLDQIYMRVGLVVLDSVGSRRGDARLSAGGD